MFFCLVANYVKGTYPKQGSLAQNQTKAQIQMLFIICHGQNM